MFNPLFPYLKMFLFGLTLLFLSLEVHSQNSTNSRSSAKCLKSFPSKAQPDIFSLAKKLQQEKDISLQKTKRTKRLTKEEFAQEKKYLLDYFKTSDLENLKLSLLNQPQLKNLRWTFKEDPPFFKRMRYNNYEWCKEGWGLLQLAAYFGKAESLSLFLDLGMNVRTKKKNTISIEDNALHISIKQNFKQGIDLILNHQPMEKFGEVRNRFIDEKSHDKKTPWFLSMKRDLTHKNTLFVNLIGQHRPSGHVQSYIVGRGRRDGFDNAYSTKNKSFIDLAHRYLEASNKYSEYRKLKQLYGKSTKPPARDVDHPSHRLFN